MPKLEFNMGEIRKGSLFPDLSDEPKMGIFEILVRGIGVLLSRTLILGEFAPFGLAFLAMERKFGKRALIALAMTLAGTVTLWSKSIIAKYALSQLLYMAVLFSFEKEEKERSVIVSGIIAGICLFASGFALIVWKGNFGFYPFISLLIESMVVFGSVFVFDKSRDILQNKTSVVDRLDSEEKLSLAIMMCIAVLSFKQINILNIFSFSNFFSIIIIMMTAFGGGVSFSVGAGIILGLVCGIGSGDMLSLMAVFAFCGLASGIGARYGKIPTVIAFVGANLAIILYVNGATDTMITLFESVAAGIVAVLIPKPFYIYIRNIAAPASNVYSITGQQEDETADAARTKENLKLRLNKASELFGNLAQTYYEIFDKNTVINYTDVSFLFDTAADRVCKSCKKCSVCWQKDFNSTYQIMFKLLAVMERKNEVVTDDVPPYFRERCIKLKPLLAQLNSLYDLYRANCLYKAKLEENRELVSEQFKGISWMMRDIIEEIDRNIEFDTQAEAAVSSMLADKGLDIRRAMVIRNSYGKYEVEIRLKACTEATSCIPLIKNTIKTVLNTTMLDEPHCCAAENELGSGECILRFNEKESLFMLCGVASNGYSESEQNGDGHLLIDLGRGKWAAVISDGMGKGDKAARESSTIVDLLQRFLQSGFDKAVAVKMINSIMSLKSSRDNYSTLDMCVLDLYTGEIEFIKVGAPASYIKRQNKVEPVRTTSLPVGVLSDIEIETFSRTVKHNDIIIMISDGLENKETGDTWIKDFIADVKRDIPPQLLADMILEEAALQNGGEANDDMTVIAIKIEEVV